jgi:hypothetical protein
VDGDTDGDDEGHGYGDGRPGSSHSSQEPASAILDYFKKITDQYYDQSPGKVSVI